MTEHMQKPKPPLTVSDRLIASGFAAGIAAYLIWGMFPAYFKWTDSIPALEILSHRVVWAVPFAAVIIMFRKQWPDVIQIVKAPKTLSLFAVTAALIAANWGVYIWAVQIDQIFQASLGYYINPLLNVVLGVFIFNEKLNQWQILAVILALIGVLILTLYGGIFPGISLFLAATFGLYGVIRKKVNAGAMPGLFIETALLFPLGLAYLIWLYKTGGLHFLHQDSFTLDTLMVIAGPITVIPLFFFAVAARRMPLSTLGFLQYIGPTLQFSLGVYYGESFTLAHALCFGCIWLAVIIFSYGAWRKSKNQKL